MPPAFLIVLNPSLASYRSLSERPPSPLLLQLHPRARGNILNTVRARDISSKEKLKSLQEEVSPGGSLFGGSLFGRKSLWRKSPRRKSPRRKSLLEEVSLEEVSLGGSLFGGSLQEDVTRRIYLWRKSPTTLRGTASKTSRRSLRVTDRQV